MRPERLYLTDIVEAADAIARFLKEIGESDFMQDELRQSAVLQKLIVIGEAAGRIPRASPSSTRTCHGGTLLAFATLPCTSIFPWTGGLFG